MEEENNSFSYNFFLAGISHQTTPTSVRSLFAINEDACKLLSSRMKQFPIGECFVLSTCNRTEIYGCAESPEVLVSFLCSVTEGCAATFIKHAYILKNNEATEHLFRVNCGLESQIPGDYEITAQVKQAAKWCKEKGLLGTYTEKMIHTALHVSKRVKNETKFSSGIISVSFAAVRFLEQIENIRNKKILLVGLGKIGKNTCKSLRSYLRHDDITIINRTGSVAHQFAAEYGLRAADFSDLKKELSRADVILVATNAVGPIIFRDSIRWNNQVIIDLSIPNNVDGSLREYKNVRVVDVDELSGIPDETLAIRKKEIPTVEAIIAAGVADFAGWCKRNERASVLVAIKDKMKKIQHNEIMNFRKNPRMDVEGFENLTSKMIQKIINVFGDKLMNENKNSEIYFQALQEMFAGHTAEETVYETL